MFYWVLLGFTGFLLGFTRFYWVLLGFTGFYWVLLGFTGFYWVFTGLNWVSMFFFCVLLGSARFYWASYWVCFFLPSFLWERLCFCRGSRVGWGAAPGLGQRPVPVGDAATATPAPATTSGELHFSFSFFFVGYFPSISNEIHHVVSALKKSTVNILRLIIK